MAFRPSGNRIREFVAGALDNAGLPVSKASAAISINAGQARLRDIVMQADGADLQATVNVDLADAMLDALLTLNAPPQAAGAAPPAVMVALKGTLPAPKRTVDTNLLTSWLTLRAVEQQSRQLEAMEQAAREAAAAAAAPRLPQSRRTGGRDRPRRRVPERGRPAGAQRDQTGCQGAAQAPALPPPITITGGAEAARRAASRQSGCGRRDRAAGKPALPGLLGAQN